MTALTSNSVRAGSDPDWLVRVKMSRIDEDGKSVTIEGVGYVVKIGERYLVRTKPGRTQGLDWF